MQYNMMQYYSFLVAPTGLPDIELRLRLPVCWQTIADDDPMEDKPAASPGRYNMISCDRVEMNCVLEVANYVLYHFVILLSTYFL